MRVPVLLVVLLAAGACGEVAAPGSPAGAPAWDVEQADMWRSDLERPGVAWPGVSPSTVERPDVVWPDLEQSDLGQSDSERPGVERPEGERPEGERPGGRPEGERAAAGGPESGRRVKVPFSASGRYAVVKGRAQPRPGRAPVVRYMVEVERGLPFDPGEFAEAVHRTLNDPRSWGRFQRVAHGPVRLSVALTSPRLTDRLCLPLNTGGDLSCWDGHRSVINAVRWARGVPQYHGDLARYRRYVINHEVGHGLGHGHRSCPGRGRLAPVMLQQSMSLDGCRPNAWPRP
ncbi:DUF3152 domain-containing protein [Nonomuraea sp. NPDC059007]|uniref:DUF3152 domain-containing protein n=1 Tax=Nonomuraea sp. NPDC059007 TaxID=3346692 RepID=UPI0036BC5BC5